MTEHEWRDRLNVLRLDLALACRKREMAVDNLAQASERQAQATTAYLTLLTEFEAWQAGGGEDAPSEHPVDGAQHRGNGGQNG